jgi:hypothetical protein
MAAISAITSVTIETKTVFGNKRVNYGYVTIGDGSSTWPSGGLSLTAAQLGLGKVESVFFIPGGVQYFYDHANLKIDGKLCGTAGAAQVQVAANGAVIASGEKVYFIAVGSRQNK